MGPYIPPTSLDQGYRKTHFVTISLIASGAAKGGDAKFVMNWLPQGRVALGIGKKGSNVRFVGLSVHL